MDWEQDNMSDSSEWSEQFKFSLNFFVLHYETRQAQREGVLEWDRALDSKLAHVMGLFNAKEQEEIIKLRRELKNKVKTYRSNIKNAKRFHNSTAFLDDEVYNIEDAIFIYEAVLDAKINKKMPFLKYAEQQDIRTMF